MPIYATLCQCGHEDMVWRRIAERDNLPVCGCGAVPTRQISAPAVHAEVALFTPYESPLTGKVVTTREQRKREMTAHGKIDWEPNIREQIKKRSDMLATEREKKIEETVDYKVRDLVMKGAFDATI